MLREPKKLKKKFMKILNLFMINVLWKKKIKKFMKNYYKINKKIK
jgi:hypothetical protein